MTATTTLPIAEAGRPNSEKVESGEVPPEVPDMQALVDMAILAPSPDNNQPWQFVAGRDYLDVHLDLSRSLPSDVNHMFDLTAIGAAVENICIASREQGFEPHVEMLSEDEALADQEPRQSTGTIPVARVRWTRGAEKDPQFIEIPRRHTNRHGYSTKRIDPAIHAELSAEVEKFSGVHVHWLTSRRDIWQFAWLVGKTDRMRFEKKEFHEELYKQLRFTPEEAETTREGLDVRTLALPPGGKLTLKLLRNWWLLALLNRFGASRFLALPSVPQVIRSGAIGICSVETPGNGFVSGGRAFQRIWHHATKQSLALHPLGSLPIYLQHESRSSSNRVKQWAADLLSPIESNTIQIAFRLGHANKPTSPKIRSLRRERSM
jgi:hypothetical protein